MSESSGSVWERIVDWFRGMFGSSTSQGDSTGSNTGASAKDTASNAASSARAGASQTLDRARNTVNEMRGKARGAADRTTSDDATAGDKGRLSGAASSVTNRGYDTGTTRETSDATVEDMDANGQDTTGGPTATASTAGTGTTAEDLDQGGPDTAERAPTGTGSGASSAAGNDVTSEQNAPAETGEGVTFSPRPNEHPEADQAATDVGSSGRPFAHEGDDWWDTDRPGMGTGSSLGEQGTGSETGTSGDSSSGTVGPSASAADAGTSTSGASFRGLDVSAPTTGPAGDAGFDGGGASRAVGSQTYAADRNTGSVTETATSSSTVTDADRSLGTNALNGNGASASTAEDIVAGYGESGTDTADTSNAGVDSPDTAPGVGYAGSSPATDREGVGSYAPSAATGDGTGASSNDAGLVQEAPDDAEARAADQANAALAGDASTDLYADVDETSATADASAGTDFDTTPDDDEDYSTAQGIVVGGLIAEDQQETGGDYTDEILVDAETQQTELPAADYADAVTDTAETTEDVTTTLGDQTTPAPTQASDTGTTGRGMTPDSAEGSEAAYQAEYGAPREAGVGTGGTAPTNQAVEDINAPTVGTKGVNWVPGDGTFAVPDGFPLKGNASSKIYHPRESSTYDRTIAEYYFATPEDAEAAGYRLPKALQKTGEASASAAGSGAAGARDAASGTNGYGAATPTASQHGATDTGTSGQTGAAARQTSGRHERPAPKGAIRAQSATCPDDHPIKGNANSRIYHMPNESSYEQTIPEFCFASEDDAKAAGFRARKH